MRARSAIQALLLFAASMLLLGVAEVRTRSIQKLLTRSLEVPEPTKSFVAMDEGEKKVVEFRVENPSALPVRLLGAPYICRLHACLEALDVPATIPPFGERSVRIRVTATGAGYFTGGIDVLTDVPAQRSVRFEVQGVIGKPATSAQRPMNSDPRSEKES